VNGPRADRKNEKAAATIGLAAITVSRTMAKRERADSSPAQPAAINGQVMAVLMIGKRDPQSDQ